MNISKFISDCHEQWSSFNVTLPTSIFLEQESHPKDRKLQHVLQNVEGMTRENILMLLNLAASNLEDNEIYVEVGSYKGASIIGAALGNKDKTFFACDNFSEYGGTFDLLVNNVSKMLGVDAIEYGTVKSYIGNVHVYNLDFRRFLSVEKTYPFYIYKIGAYYYDAAHDYESQYDGLKYALPHLADNALIIIDDGNYQPTRMANEKFASEHKEFKLLLDIHTPNNGHETWWNGIMLYKYCKDAK